METAAAFFAVIVLPLVTEAVKAAADRWSWFDAHRLAPPISGLAALLVYLGAWIITSRDPSTLGEYARWGMSVAFGGVALHSVGAKFAPKTTRKIEQGVEDITGKVSLGGDR